MDAASPPATGRLVVIIPVGTLDGAKSRLGGSLDAEERRDLAIRLLTRTIAAARSTRGVAEVLVVTPDDDVRALATAGGARSLRQRSQGLNAGLREARTDALGGGADAIAILPIDLPMITSAALADALAPLAAPDRPLVVVVPDRHGRGTNFLVVAPPDAIEFGFGGDSRAAHAACARDAGARLIELDGPLRLDLDTPDDLLFVEEVAPEAVGAG
jgi:2-phospho-L-lactate guanylyltransferase